MATDASIAENIRRGAPLPGFESLTTMSRIAAGISPSSRQAVASEYFFPAERSLAPTQVTSNHG